MMSCDSPIVASNTFAVCALNVTPATAGRFLSSRPRVVGVPRVDEQPHARERVRLADPA